MIGALMRKDGEAKPEGDNQVIDAQPPKLK